MEEGLEGTTLGRYRVGRLLGAGGMGAVHAGVQEPLGRPVAIKVLRPEIAKNADIVARFKREAELAASLSHPNIAQVTDFGVENGRAFLVMDLLEGESLGDLLQREGRMSEGRVQRIAMQVLTALATAHERGVVHRDLKPENVFVQRVSGMELVKLLDFGIARMVESDHSMTNTGAVLGTPAYMSPEQARGRRVDARSDVFSIGAVLYEMLAGRRPFEAENYHELMFAVVEETPTPLTELDPAMTPALAQIVERAMNKTPEARFASAAEMRDAIGALAGLREGGPAPISSMPPTRAGDSSPQAFAATMASDPGPVTPVPSPAAPAAAAPAAAPAAAASAPMPATPAPVAAAPAPPPRRPLALVIGAPIAALSLLALGAWAATALRGAPPSAPPLAAATPPPAGTPAAPMQPLAPAAPDPGSSEHATPPERVTTPEATATAELTPTSPGAPGAAEPEPRADADEAPARVADGPRAPRAAAAGFVVARCGEGGTSQVELPIVTRRDQVSVSSAQGLEGFRPGSISGVRRAVHDQASGALTSCYRGRPILQGQSFDLSFTAEGTVEQVAPRVYCPLDPAVVSCARRALSDVVLSDPQGTPFRARFGIGVQR